jgi:lysophospholipase L1-like esterase
MRSWIALIAGSLLLFGPAFAQESDPCEVPAYLLFSDAELLRVEKAVKETKQVKVLVVGSGSSLLAGGGGPALSYPARLEAALKEKLPGVAVTVKPFAKPRQTAEDMAQGVEKLLQEEQPNLVVWQTGTVDAMRGLDPEDFRLTLDEGVETMHANGADVVLMNSQYSPRTESLIANTAYTDNMKWVAQHRNVPLYDRLSIMRHWSDNGTFDFTVGGRDFALAQKVHNCIGKTLAAQIVESAHLGGFKAKP